MNQYCYGLELLDNDSVWRLIHKPTRFRTTGYYTYAMLYTYCPGTHKHTPLEGFIKGVSLRSKLAENYPLQLTVGLARTLLKQLVSNNYTLAVDNKDNTKIDNANMDNGLLEVVGKLPVPKPETKDIRTIDYIKYLYKNLGYPSSKILHRILQEV